VFNIIFLKETKFKQKIDLIQMMIVSNTMIS